MHFQLLDARDSLAASQLRNITELLRSVDPQVQEMTRGRMADVIRTSTWVLGRVILPRESEIVALGILVPKDAFELAWVETLIVSPGRRRQGMGGQLTQRLITAARSQGHQRIEAELHDEGSPADRLMLNSHFSRGSDRYVLSLV